MEHNRPFCASVDHSYVQVTAMWCAHEQAWTLYRTVYSDGATETVDVQVNDLIRMGPFDDAPVVLAELTTWLEHNLPQLTA
jgi:hypothetical protein